MFDMYLLVFVMFNKYLIIFGDVLAEVLGTWGKGLPGGLDLVCHPGLDPLRYYYRMRVPNDQSQISLTLPDGLAAPCSHLHRLVIGLLAYQEDTEGYQQGTENVRPAALAKCTCALQ